MRYLWPCASGASVPRAAHSAACVRAHSERANKAQIKEAHRKIMLLNHPDRGGSPFIATKINEASECLNGQNRSTGSAFS